MHVYKGICWNILTKSHNQPNQNMSTDIFATPTPTTTHHHVNNDEERGEDDYRHHHYDHFGLTLAFGTQNPSALLPSFMSHQEVSVRRCWFVKRRVSPFLVNLFDGVDGINPPVKTPKSFFAHHVLIVRAVLFDPHNENLCPVDAECREKLETIFRTRSFNINPTTFVANLGDITFQATSFPRIGYARIGLEFFLARRDTPLVAFARQTSFPFAHIPPLLSAPFTIMSERLKSAPPKITSTGTVYPMDSITVFPGIGNTIAGRFKQFGGIETVADFAAKTREEVDQLWMEIRRDRCTFNEFRYIQAYTACVKGAKTNVGVQRRPTEEGRGGWGGGLPKYYNRPLLVPKIKCGHAQHPPVEEECFVDGNGHSVVIVDVEKRMMDDVENVDDDVDHVDEIEEII